MPGNRRYDRQIQLPNFGEAGQEALAQASVLMIGAGGLGAPILSYLAAAGIGTLGIADDDAVELSNLPRQILFETGDIGRPKTQAAKERLRDMNPEIRIKAHALRVDESNVAGLIMPYSLVIDGSDNFATRFIVAEECFMQKKPLLSAAVLGMEGNVALFTGTPCYRCFVPHAPDAAQNCREQGVLGPVAGVIGSIAASEAIKYFTGLGTSLRGQVLHYDGYESRTTCLRLPSNPTCPLCSKTA